MATQDSIDDRMVFDSLKETEVLSEIEKRILLEKITKRVHSELLLHRKFWRNARWGAVAATVLIALTSLGLWQFRVKDSVELAVAGKTYDIHKVAYDQFDRSMHHARIGHEVELWIRGVHKLSATLENRVLHLKLDKVNSAVSFEKSDRIRELMIETPKATYHILGTKFVVWADSHESSLFVQSSWVLARDTKGGRQMSVAPRQFYSSITNAVKDAPAAIADTVYVKFTGTGGDVPIPFSTPRQIKPRAPATVPTPQASPIPQETAGPRFGKGMHVKVLLKDKKAFSGRILDISDDDIQLDLETGKTISISREDIAKMNIVSHK